MYERQRDIEGNIDLDESVTAIRKRMKEEGARQTD